MDAGRPEHYSSNPPTTPGMMAEAREGLAARTPRPASHGGRPASRRAAASGSRPATTGSSRLERNSSNDINRIRDGLVNLAPSLGRYGSREHSNLAVPVVAGGGGSEKSQSIPSSEHGGGQDGGRLRSKHQVSLRPISRRQPGYVYSKKMTFGRTLSPTSRKALARKRRTPAAKDAGGGVPTVRSMLPWWQNIYTLVGQANMSASGLAASLEFQDSNLSLRDTPTGGADGGEQTSPQQQRVSSTAPENTQNKCNVGGGDSNLEQQQSIDDKIERSPPSPNEVDAIPSSQINDGGPQVEKAYNHYSNLFENPPPTMPTVDQYIFEDSITYGAITKRGQSKALPVNVSSGGALGIGQRGGGSSKGAAFVGAGGDDTESYVDPSALLFADEDIDKLLKFFDKAGRGDEKVTLEEMISGFRKIRREWATVKAERAGRVVLAKVVRLMRRAGMSLEEWFKFMDTSQNGHGDGKLTALELRVGFERLSTHIARRECCCRAFKCNRIPNYGLPPLTGPQIDAAGDGFETANGTSIDGRSSSIGVVRDLSVVERTEQQGNGSGHARDHGHQAPSDRGKHRLHESFEEAGPTQHNHSSHNQGCTNIDGDTKSSFTPDGNPDPTEKREPTCAGGGGGGGQLGEREPLGGSAQGDAGGSSPGSTIPMGHRPPEGTYGAGVFGDGGSVDAQRLSQEMDVLPGSPCGGGGGGGSGRSKTIAARSEEESGCETDHCESDLIPAGAKERPSAWQEQWCGADNEGGQTENNKEEGAESRTRTSSMDILNAGRAIACREHALDGMVYLGQRAYFLGLESETFNSKDVSDLMRFIDTDVDFSLDIREMRLAISRLHTDEDEDDARTSEAGNLLQVLESYMHRTGARFTDVFFFLDRRVLGGKCSPDSWNRSGYIEKHELRKLFEALSREPARRKARARAKAELAEERTRQKELRTAEAHDASERLEMYKKAGVYSVLKRIEVWQARTGKRLSESFRGSTGDGAGNHGLDVDELAAFMRNLDFELSPAEAMLVLRHLDGGNNGLVEVGEVATAVRDIRRYEMIVKAAREDHILGGPSGGGGARRPPLVAAGTVSSCDAAFDDAGRDECGADGAGVEGGVGYLWECPGVYGREHFPSSFESMQDGPAVFRPPLDIITHGRASTAPARARRSKRGALVASRRPTTATTDTGSLGGGGNRPPLARAGGTASREPGAAWPGRLVGSTGDVTGGGGRGVAGGGVARPGSAGRGARGGDSAADSINTLQQQQRRRQARRSPRPGPQRGISSKHFLEDGGDDGTAIGRATGRANKGRNALSAEVVGKAGAADTNRAVGSATSVSSAAAAAEGVEEPQPPWVLGLRDGWWPAAMSAVEDGARLNIYTGSVLDGRWLNSLDARLTKTMRATRR
ncbi:unnamed protein product [Ectocarpus fasciculatus]